MPAILKITKVIHEIARELTTVKVDGEAIHEPEGGGRPASRDQAATVIGAKSMGWERKGSVRVRYVNFNLLPRSYASSS
jgi:hypothetical protein